MKRLTKRYSNGEVKQEIYEINMCNGTSDVNEGYAEAVLKRLASYEDTGLMPDEISELSSKTERLSAEVKELDKECCHYRRLSELALKEEKDGA